LIIKKKYFLSSIILSLALSSRLSNIFIILFTYLFLFLEFNKSDKIKLFFSGLLNLILTLTLYLPVYFYSSKTFSFLGYSIGNWNFLQHVVRFFYKNVALFGLIIFIFIYYRIILLSSKLNLSKLDNKKVYLFILTLILVQEALFLKIPLEISYLIPNLILTIIVYSLLEKNRTIKYFILLFSIFNLFINVDFLNIKHDFGSPEAEGASIGLFFKKGVLIEDLRSRNKSQIYFQKSGNY
jgi:hypothetical protein